MYMVALALSGCEACETVANADGKVYDCGDVEYCYHDDSAAELSALTGKVCHEAGLRDRLWPGLTNLFERGCEYDCAATTPGCNAEGGGCYCPASMRKRIGFTNAGAIGRIDYALHGAIVDASACESYFARPAFACRGVQRLDFDGCRWRCMRTVEIGPRQ